MGDETSIRIYIRGRFPKKRERNIKALALKYFPLPSGKKGNVAALFHDALNRMYNLDPETSAPREPLPEMVSDKKFKTWPASAKATNPKKRA